MTFLSVLRVADTMYCFIICLYILICNNFFLSGDQHDAGRIGSEIVHFREHFFARLVLCEAGDSEVTEAERGWMEGV